MHVCSDERATVVGLDERIQSEQTELVAMRCIIAGFHAMKQLCCRNILGDNMILIDGGVFFLLLKSGLGVFFADADGHSAYPPLMLPSGILPRITWVQYEDNI